VSHIGTLLRSGMVVSARHICDRVISGHSDQPCEACRFNAKIMYNDLVEHLPRRELELMTAAELCAQIRSACWDG
jgi:hypothetical protein